MSFGFSKLCVSANLEFSEAFASFVLVEPLSVNSHDEVCVQHDLLVLFKMLDISATESAQCVCYWYLVFAMVSAGAGVQVNGNRADFGSKNANHRKIESDVPLRRWNIFISRMMREGR